MLSLPIISLLTGGPLAIIGICYFAWRSGIKETEQRQGYSILKSKSNNE